MVRLTTDVLLRCSSSYIKKRREETRKHYLRRVTHLHLEDRAIDEIGDELECCQNLTVLYMYDNQLSQLPNLSRNIHLTHVYLQNNCIEQLAGARSLAELNKITKLYLGGNRIVVVEGLESQQQLQELHIENQLLESGEKLLFDPRSLWAVANTLTVLNITGNGISSLAELDCLTSLQQLSASDNQLANLRELTGLLRSSWQRIHRLDIANNPLCRRAKYRDRIIVAAPALETLDGVEVSETTKQFLRSWAANRDAIKQRLTTASNTSTQQLPPDTDTYASAKSDADIYPSVPATYLMPALNGHKFQQFLARSHSQQESVGDTRSIHNLSYGGICGSHFGSSDVITGNLRHLSLHNINLECLNSNVPL